MKHIESRANPLYKQLYKWQSSAGRRGEPALLDGLHLCEAWLASGRRPLHALFDVDRIEHPAHVGLIRRLNAEQCVTMSGSLLRTLSSFDSDQGVIFVAQQPVFELPERLKEPVVLFDRIQDPGNVGTLLRTCAAAGIRRVLASPGTAALWSPKVLRSAQGAHFGLQMHEQVNLMDVLDRLDVALVATALDDAQDLFATHLPAKCAWVFGHEGQGVDAALLKRATLRVRIEHDPSVESLNVTAAAAICLFEQRRQLSTAA